MTKLHQIIKKDRGSLKMLEGFLGLELVLSYITLTGLRTVIISLTFRVKIECGGWMHM